MNEAKDIVMGIIDSIAGNPQITSLGVTDRVENIMSDPLSDIDIFVFCAVMPDKELLLDVIKPYGDTLHFHDSNIWGQGFHGSIKNKDISIMFFTQEQTMRDIELTLTGNQLERHSNGYYPIGRCYTLLNMNILNDSDNFLKSVQKKLSVYPEKLRETLIKYHYPKINDIEDFNRAVMRKDVLFYHYVLDMALDHLLQCIFAINRTYFPSRKKSLQFIDEFSIKPENFKENLLQAIELGNSPSNLSKSYDIWQVLFKDIYALL